MARQARKEACRPHAHATCRVLYRPVTMGTRAACAGPSWVGLSAIGEAYNAWARVAGGALRPVRRGCQGFCRCTLPREGRIGCRAEVAAHAFWGGPCGWG